MRTTTTASSRRRASASSPGPRRSAARSTAFVAGSGVDDSWAGTLGGHGASRVLVADDPALAGGLPQPIVDAIEASAREADAVLFGAGVVSADIAAGLAARIGAGIACETTEIALADGGVVATRPALGDTVMVESGFRGTGIVLARANASTGAKALARASTMPVPAEARFDMNGVAKRRPRGHDAAVGEGDLGRLAGDAGADRGRQTGGDVGRDDAGAEEHGIGLARRGLQGVHDGLGQPPASAGSSATSTLPAPWPPSAAAQPSSMPLPATNAVTSPPSVAAFARMPRLLAANSPSSWCA